MSVLQTILVVAAGAPLLLTLAEVATEHNSTLVLPIPMDGEDA